MLAKEHAAYSSRKGELEESYKKREQELKDEIAKEWRRERGQLVHDARACVGARAGDTEGLSRKWLERGESASRDRSLGKASVWRWPEWGTPRKAKVA